jgi:hypothetical protein
LTAIHTPHRDRGRRRSRGWGPAGVFGVPVVTPVAGRTKWHDLAVKDEIQAILDAHDDPVVALEAAVVRLAEAVDRLAKADRVADEIRHALSQAI